MIVLRSREAIVHAANRGAFWIALTKSIVNAWFVNALVVGLQFFVIALTQEGLNAVVFGLLAVVLSPLFSWVGVVGTLPLTIVGGLAIRCHWTVVTIVYGLAGSAAMMVLNGSYSADWSLRSPAAELRSALLGVLPAAAYGYVIWRKLMR